MSSNITVHSELQRELETILWWQACKHDHILTHDYSVVIWLATATSSSSTFKDKQYHTVTCPLHPNITQLDRGRYSTCGFDHIHLCTQPSLRSHLHTWEVSWLHLTQLWCYHVGKVCIQTDRQTDRQTDLLLTFKALHNLSLLISQTCFPPTPPLAPCNLHQQVNWHHQSSNSAQWMLGFSPVLHPNSGTPSRLTSVYWTPLKIFKTALKAHLFKWAYSL